jgi:alkanesulfonate monooxygenase SsuD/methylene tetrahydromethanopterin reductase-like flavin-dependent oxidoreductase (luciferase family)
MTGIGGTRNLCERFSMPPTLGVVFRPQQPPEELRAVVQSCEQAGTAELWLWEDCFLEGGLTAATAALAWSETLRVGIGLLPVPLRNPALVAMELATLARIWPGRSVVALGHGIQEWMAQVGAAADSPMTLLREHASAVRELLAGERVDVDGRYVTLHDVRLDWPPARPPDLLIGARGPKTVALAAEIADGVLLDSVADVDAVRRARQQIEAVAESAGRETPTTITIYTELDPTQDPTGLGARLSDRADSLGEAGADAVIFHATAADPDPRPLIEAIASLTRPTS